MASDYAVQIQKILREYGEEVLSEVDKIAVELMNEGISELKAVREPPATKPGVNTNAIRDRHDWKKYSSGWKGKAEKSYNRVSAVIYNDHPAQTSWLEYGHATVNGGRTRAFEHIKPVEQKIKDEFEKRVEEALK